MMVADRMHSWLVWLKSVIGSLLITCVNFCFECRVLFESLPSHNGFWLPDTWVVLHDRPVFTKHWQTSSSRSISSSGRHCPNVSAKLMPVLACLLAAAVMSFSHLCLGFPPLILPATIPCIIVLSKPLWRVTWLKYFSCWHLTKWYSQFVGRWS